MSPLFAATVEATEEAIYNAILKATSVSSVRGSLKAIPLEELVRVLRKYNVLETKRTASRYLFCRDTVHWPSRIAGYWQGFDKQ